MKLVATHTSFRPPLADRLPGRDPLLRERVESAWRATWTRFYKSETNQFYDYLTSYEPEEGLAHLPTADEVGRQFPNKFGYGTGMEDCMISAGVMLDMIADRHAVTRDETLRVRAREVLQGIRRSTLDHGYPGFVARGVCHESPRLIYKASSRDQYTHVVHGLWVYFLSELPDENDRALVTEIVTAIAGRLLKNVIQENDYDSLCADGTREDERGYSRMWNVRAHEAARLPMIHAAAWDITKRPDFYAAYRQYIVPAIEQSLDFEQADGVAPWTLPQMQLAFALLAALETDEILKRQLHALMAKVAARAARGAESATVRAATLDLTLLAPDWRASGGLVPPYRTAWYCPREAGEALTTQLLDGRTPFPVEQQELLRNWFTRLLDFGRVSSSGIFHLQNAYWKARRRDCFVHNETSTGSSRHL